MVGIIKKQYVNIRDIAKLSGVSIATVSRVLNSPEVTTPQIRKKVEKVIKEYDYVPNREAKNLYSGSSNSIALFVFDMDNPFYTNLIHHLNRVTFINDYTLLICDISGDPALEIKYYNYCKSMRVAGIIYTAGPSRDLIADKPGSTAIPTVLIDRAEFKNQPCFTVQSDHEKGTQLLVDYLYRLNHRKIGYISGTCTTLSAQQRLADFQYYAKQYGLHVPDEYVRQGEFSVQCGISSFDYFYSLSDTPTAIITADDQTARGFIMRANSLGVSIPEEFSVCGWDAVEASYFYPPITSVKQDIESIAHAAFSFIQNCELTPAPASKLIDVSISIGQTCHKL